MKYNYAEEQVTTIARLEAELRDGETEGSFAASREAERMRAAVRKQGHELERARVEFAATDAATPA